MSASLRYSLLGIAVLLFGLAFPIALAPLLAYILAPFTIGRLVFDALGLILPLAGLILALIGFFKRT